MADFLSGNKKVWLQLEASQILPTVPAGQRTSVEGWFPWKEWLEELTSYFKGGIKFELEQRESPSQDYPLTIAFLQLVHKVCLR